MKELNQAVYYTTAQVTELVDLSDQNVRKYVRLLEDRNYEVAKDEHNRRLFSANDVLILRALITQAKKPGYTLDSAADEIVKQVADIISSKDHKVSSSTDNNEIREMFSHVIERLDAIQAENKDLKDNVRNLVVRLEQYDHYEAQRYIDYGNNVQNNAVENSPLKDHATDSEDEDSEENSLVNNTINDDAERTRNDIDDDTDISEIEQAKERQYDEDYRKEAPSVSEVADDGNVDMSVYKEEVHTKEEEEPTPSIQDKNPHEHEEKSGFFGNLFKMFRK